MPTLNLGKVVGPQGPQGNDGPEGPQGIQGPPGEGVPAGGAEFQILSKKTDADYDTKWISCAGRSMAGETVKPTSTTTVGAGIGAEIFNDLRTRTYEYDSVATGNVASGLYSHAEGECCTAEGNDSHAEGYRCIASAPNSHSEGSNCTASGTYSHAEGRWCTSGGICSHAGGDGCVTNADCQTAIGSYNVESTAKTDRLIIGKGTVFSKANCFRATDTGVYASGNYSASGADYAELFEWQDGNPDAEDRAGRFITLTGEKIRLAAPGDKYILGVVSGNPSVVGDVYDDQWQGMYLTDIFGRPLWEDVEVPDETIEEPNPENPEEKITRVIRPAHTERRQKLNPDYDPAQTYQPRTSRPEWDAVGLVGKLVVVDDGTCIPDEFCTVGNGGIATASEAETKYRVMSRLDETHIRIMVL